MLYMCIKETKMKSRITKILLCAIASYSIVHYNTYAKNSATNNDASNNQQQNDKVIDASNDLKEMLYLVEIENDSNNTDTINTLLSILKKTSSKHAKSCTRKYYWCVGQCCAPNNDKDK